MKYLTLCALAGLMLSGCASNNIQPYKADASDFVDLAKSTHEHFSIENVSMPEGDTNAIMCRLNGNIYLPNKMTYSEYVRYALEKALIATNKMGDKKSSRKINLKLTTVNFCSVSGKWEIIGELTVDNGKPVAVKSSTDYGTSYDAYSACRNVADAFPNAVTNFIKEIVRALA